MTLAAVTTLEGVGRTAARGRAPLSIAACIGLATAALLFGTHHVLGAWAGFDPAWFTLVVFCDLITGALLIEQYRSGEGPRTLVLSWAYGVSAALLILSSLAVPGVMTVHGVWGGEIRFIWWLWLARHVVYAVVVGAALAPWPARVTAWLSRPEDRTLLVGLTGVALAVPVAALALVGTRSPRSLPDLTRVSDGHVGLRAGYEVALLALCFTALAYGGYGVWQRRHAAAGLEAWAVVALTAVCGDVLLVVVDHDPDSASFYGGRALAVTASLVVLLFIFAGVSRAYRQTTDEAHRLEEENGELIEAQRLREHMTAVVSHDMRTPLAGLQGYLEMLLEDDELAPALETRMHERSWMLTRRLTLLTEDLLAAATLAHGDLVVAPEPLDLAAQLTECTQVFPDLDLRVVSPEEVSIEADPLRLQQILANLVRNAQKHGAEPVTITARATPDAVTIIVSDAGPGVPAAFIPRLFDRYSQAAGSTGGSGLGLSVVRDLVTAHGGTIRYDADVNGFLFTIPRPAREAVGPAAQAHAEPRGPRTHEIV